MITDGELAHAWRTEVFDRGEDIDPNDEHLWSSLALGFALGRGATIEQAQALSDRWDTAR